VFFKLRKEDYVAATELKRTDVFYKKVAHKYLAVYIYHTPWDGDLEKGQEVADDVDPDEDLDDVPPEEAEHHTKYFKELKRVCL
jgi:putative NIF3 family GTP cyclohydrolase 1 type 2